MSAERLTGAPVRAVWNEVVLPESDETIVVEGNHYFPPESVDFTTYSRAGSGPAASRRASHPGPGLEILVSPVRSGRRHSRSSGSERGRSVGLRRGTRNTNPSSLPALEGRAPELQQLERDRALLVNTNMPPAVIRVALYAALS
jgi:Domain of unknown function (DUF427)